MLFNHGEKREGKKNWLLREKGKRKQEKGYWCLLNVKSVNAWILLHFHTHYWTNTMPICIHHDIYQPRKDDRQSQMNIIKFHVYGHSVWDGDVHIFMLDYPTKKEKKIDFEFYFIFHFPVLKVFAFLSKQLRTLKFIWDWIHSNPTAPNTRKKVVYPWGKGDKNKKEATYEHGK